MHAPLDDEDEAAVLDDEAAVDDELVVELDDAIEPPPVPPAPSNLKLSPRIWRHDAAPRAMNSAAPAMLRARIRTCLPCLRTRGRPWVR
jgi:hypothetical protein